MKIAIDTDILLFQACFGAQSTVDWGDVKSVQADINKAKNTFRATIREYQNVTGVKPYVLALSSPTNFRKKQWDQYKMNRKDGERPILLPELRDWVKESYPTIVIDDLEADDVLGILATKHPGEIIHASMDKDLLGIPGKMLYVKKNRKHQLIDISPQDAKRFHYLQTMMGDGADGVPGVSGIGPAKAAKYMDTFGVSWQTVVRCYTDNGLSEAEALRNAIMVKILDNDHYQDGKVIIWSPPHDELVES